MTEVTRSDISVLKGDSAKSLIADDEFGLAKIVSALADVLSRRIEAQSYVLGIEGKWGAGKTTLSNFIQEEMQKSSPDQAILRFDPWLISEKNSLLPVLLGLLASTIEQISISRMPLWRIDYWLFDYWLRKKIIKTLSKQIRRYGRHAAALSQPVAAAAPLDPTGVTLGTAAGLRAVGWFKNLLDREDFSIHSLLAAARTVRLASLSATNFAE